MKTLSNLEDLERILELRGICYEREGGALVHNLITVPGEHKLVMEIKDPYETSIKTRVLWIYIPELLVGEDEADRETEEQLSLFHTLGIGKFDRVLDGRLIGIAWSIPLSKFNTKEEVGELMEKIISTAQKCYSNN